jgi:hypothetical protein
MSKIRMYEDAEQEIIDAFSNLIDMNRHIFKFRVIIKDKYEPYHTKNENAYIAQLIENAQQHQLELLKRINELRSIFKEDD